MYIHHQTINLTVIIIREQSNRGHAEPVVVTWMGLNPPFNYEARKQQETERKPMEKLIDQQEGIGHSMQLNKNIYLVIIGEGGRLENQNDNSPLENSRTHGTEELNHT